MHRSRPESEADRTEASTRPKLLLYHDIEAGAVWRMTFQTELITFLCGLGVAVFVALSRRRAEQLQHWRPLLLAFYFLFAGWTVRVTKVLLRAPQLGTVEHVCYAASALLLAGWCWAGLLRGSKHGLRRRR